MQDLPNQRLVLVLQSEPTHRQLIQGMLAEHDVHPHIVAIDNTQDALNFLRQQEQFANSHRPDLILLDLELGGKTTGYDLLALLKTDPSLRRIPIIVLTLSDRLEDIVKTYAVQGNCYVIRPGDRQQLAETIRRIEDFWLKIVTLPRE
uniref:Response regulator receiver protein n=1 Tax=Cyanothece sp. (strain PCC 7425 / ATCC 29141) TaxID=395961 RepID=B8HKH4_CYAP4